MKAKLFWSQNKLIHTHVHRSNTKEGNHKLRESRQIPREQMYQKAKAVLAAKREIKTKDKEGA